MNYLGSWSSCYTNMTSTAPCGSGFMFRSPYRCVYNNTKNETEYEHLCGAKPIHARSCFAICSGEDGLFICK